jgi:serine/threonine-protein kinase RsbW
MDSTTTLVIPADLGAIPTVGTALDEAMRARAFSEDTIRDLQLAVEEAIANTVIHGYRGAAGDVVVAIRATDDAVEVRIEDRASPFDPVQAPEPDLDSGLDERRVGGLGIFMIRQLVDEVAYQHTGGMNVLLLVKRRQA